ncbi:hypothetical protein PIB30_091464 [Stylosanthes scabra]|uniref:Uncharacterized protein n=1 Tax=Stylosanthes scabra TaxID=79078 RepID=A0ABU6ZTJ2_9FABA|nr:hypothetical protein [Stylosanthes scabra]
MQKRRLHKEESMRSGETELYSSDWSELGLFRKMNSMSTTFMLKTSSGSKRFYEEFTSEDQCAEILLMLSILTSCHYFDHNLSYRVTARPRTQMAQPRHPLLNDEVYVEGTGARWTWRGRTIACCALNLKAKKGISSQDDAYK